MSIFWAVSFVHDLESWNWGEFFGWHETNNEEFSLADSDNNSYFYYYGFGVLKWNMRRTCGVCLFALSPLSKYVWEWIELDDMDEPAQVEYAGSGEVMDMCLLRQWYSVRGICDGL